MLGGEQELLDGRILRKQALAELGVRARLGRRHLLQTLEDTRIGRIDQLVEVGRDASRRIPEYLGRAVSALDEEAKDRPAFVAPNGDDGIGLGGDDGRDLGLEARLGGIVNDILGDLGAARLECRFGVAREALGERVAAAQDRDVGGAVREGRLGHYRPLHDLRDGRAGKVAIARRRAELRRGVGTRTHRHLGALDLVEQRQRDVRATGPHDRLRALAEQAVERTCRDVGVAGVVGHDQLNLVADHAAACVDVLDGYFERRGHAGAEQRGRSGQRQEPAINEFVLGPRRACGESRDHECDSPRPR